MEFLKKVSLEYFFSLEEFVKKSLKVVPLVEILDIFFFFILVLRPNWDKACFSAFIRNFNRNFPQTCGSDFFPTTQIFFSAIMEAKSMQFQNHMDDFFQTLIGRTIFNSKNGDISYMRKK